MSSLVLLAVAELFVPVLGKVPLTIRSRFGLRFGQPDVAAGFVGREVERESFGLSIPLWEDIPKDSRYWADTTKQKW